MADIQQTKTNLDYVWNIYFQDKSNFFDAIKNKIDNLHINLETKKELKRLLILMNTKKDLKWLIEWTQEEQIVFEQKIKNVENDDTSILDKYKKIKDFMYDEVDREELEIFLKSVKKIKREYIPSTAEITSQERELEIVVYEDNTIKEALDKIDKNWYNCVFLLDWNNKFLGIFTKYQLKAFNKNMKLSEISDKKITSFWKKDIKNKEAVDVMIKLWINAFPIVDDKWILFGVISIKDIKKNIEKNKCILSLTELNLDFLKKETEINSLDPYVWWKEELL